jgi:hypothetical protein
MTLMLAKAMALGGLVLIAAGLSAYCAAARLAAQAGCDWELDV